MIMITVAQNESKMQKTCKIVGVLKNNTESKIITSIVDVSINASAAPGLPFIIAIVVKKHAAKLMIPDMVP